MANSYLVHVISLVLFCYAIYKPISSWVTSYRFRQFAQARGCKPLHNASPANFIAALCDCWARMGRFMRSRATGEDILDDILAEQFIYPTIHTTQFDGSQIVQTLEPANLQALLATQFKDFETGARRIAQLSPALGISIFTSDGSAWEHSRALFRPQFNREQINDLQMTKLASQEFIDAIGAVDQEGWTQATKTFPLLLNFTLDTATEFLFGESVGSQKQANKARNGQVLNRDRAGQQSAAEQSSSKQFMEDLALVNHYMLLRIRNQGLYWIADAFEFRAAIRRIKSFTENYVKLALNSAATEKNVGRKYNLLSALVTQTQNRTELRNQTLAILLAGRDTTSALLAWCLVRLSLHPEVWHKLRSVVLHEFDNADDITFAKLKECRYLQHFLNEVLRLHPIVPFNNRVAVKDTTLPRGGGVDQQSPIAIRKGQMIMYSVYLMHRRKDLWGEDALEFKPDRWERRIPAWQFLPFNGGPRICIGQQFALTEASFLLVRVLQTFDRIEPASPETAKMKKGLGLTMWPGDEACVRLHKA